MLNHNRGLWGYTGEAPDGAALTVQATGLGGPSAAVVVGDLVALGPRRLVRVGTCAAVDPGLVLGDFVVADRGDRRRRREPGARAGDELLPDAELEAALDVSAIRGAVISTDLDRATDGHAGALAALDLGRGARRGRPPRRPRRDRAARGRGRGGRAPGGRGPARGRARARPRRRGAARLALGARRLRLGVDLEPLLLARDGRGRVDGGGEPAHLGGQLADALLDALRRGDAGGARRGGRRGGRRVLDALEALGDRAQRGASGARCRPRTGC